MINARILDHFLQVDRLVETGKPEILPRLALELEPSQLDNRFASNPGFGKLPAASRRDDGYAAS